MSDMDTESRTHHIVRLTAENVLGLRAVNITPGGNLVEIAGRNGQGKTSVLDALWFALQGAEAAKLHPDPIRHGEDKAFSSVYLDSGLVITRHWSARSKGTTRLEIRSADGAILRSPQKILNDLVDSRALDPEAFSRLKGAAQRQALLDLVELPFDLVEMDARRQAVFDARSEVNRVIKRLDGQLAGIPQPAANTPSEEVSVADLLHEHGEALRKQNKAASFMADVEKRRMDLAAATLGLKEAQAWVKVSTEALENAEDAARRIPEKLPDPDAIKDRIDSAEATNAAVREAAKRREVDAQLEEALNEAERLTKELEEIDSEKARGLRTAKMPVEGLGFGPDGVTFNDVAISQCSGAERLRVSASIAMAANPALRVLRITEGCRLDSDSMALLEEMAVEHDFQLWVETVGDGGPSAVVIEDGRVKR